MKLKKLAIVAAVSAAMGGQSAITFAAITGVPGEALLAPMVLSGSKDDLHHNPTGTLQPNYSIETYIGLYVPETIGQDTVINRYTAPHVAPGPGVTTQVLPENPRIYWTLFDQDSKKVDDGYCYVSVGDKVVWTTDWLYRERQQEQTAATQNITTPVVPSSVCGPSLPTTRFGYVTFQTVAGADGNNADFAFWGNEWILEDNVISTNFDGNSIASVPIMPMADGYDLSVNESPQLYNEVIASGTLHQTPPVADSPSAVAPIATGIRMNNADGDEDELVTLQAEIRGPVTGNEMSLHVFWFDKNNDQRLADLDVWDDQEGTCSDSWPLYRELNLVLYNSYYSFGPGFGVNSGWANLAGGQNAANRGMTDVISVVQPNPLTGYSSGTYCETAYWNQHVFAGATYPGALNGYVQYQFPEEGTGLGPDLVDSAAVAFNWQESVWYAHQTHQTTGVDSGWSSHMTTDLGKQ